MRTPEFLWMTLGDLFAEFDRCKTEFLRAANANPPDWTAAHTHGRRACYLSQCIAPEIGNRKRREDMPCNQACALLGDLTTAVRQLLASPDAAGREEAKDLERYTENMERRIEELEKMGRESEDLDKTVFGLETAEIPVELSKR